MILGGLDPASYERNPSGVAILRNMKFETSTLFKDEDILNFFLFRRVKWVGIDAPLTLREDRYADRYLHRYGAVSLKLSSIRKLAERGLQIASLLESHGILVFEVFPTATAKILGFYSMPKRRMLEYFREVGFEIERVRNEHEVDAIIAAYTVYLHRMGRTRIVDGVIIPKEKGKD